MSGLISMVTRWASRAGQHTGRHGQGNQWTDRQSKEKNHVPYARFTLSILFVYVCVDVCGPVHDWLLSMDWDLFFIDGVVIEEPVTIHLSVLGDRFDWAEQQKVRDQRRFFMIKMALIWIMQQLRVFDYSQNVSCSLSTYCWIVLEHSKKPLNKIKLFRVATALVECDYTWKLWDESLVIKIMCAHSAIDRLTHCTFISRFFYSAAVQVSDVWWG